MNILKVSAGTLVILIIVAIIEYLLLQHYIRIGNGIAERAVAFQRDLEQPELKILTLGDSSMVGTGASGPENSTSGLLAVDFPNASIKNLAVNGARAAEVVGQMQPELNNRYDLIVVQIGGNDIVRFTDYAEWEQSIRNIVETAKTMTDHLIIMHGGDIGDARLIPFGTRWIITNRTKKARDMYTRLAEELGFSYVNVFDQNLRDGRPLQRRDHYAADNFHPSDLQYQYWYDQIKKVIEL